MIFSPSSRAQRGDLPFCLPLRTVCVLPLPYLGGESENRGRGPLPFAAQDQGTKKKGGLPHRFAGHPDVDGLRLNGKTVRNDTSSVTLSLRRVLPCASRKRFFAALRMTTLASDGMTSIYHPEPAKIRSFCLLVRHRERSVAICLSAFPLGLFLSNLCHPLGEGPFHSLRKTKEQRGKPDCHTVLPNTLIWMHEGLMAKRFAMTHQM